MSNPYTLVIREVYEDGGEHFLTVAPGSDGFGVEIRTTGDNAEYYGPIRICIPKGMAYKLGQALMDCDGEVDQ